MWKKVVPWVVCLLFLNKMRPATSQEDSLRSALKAVNRLQRDLSDNRGYEDYYFTDDYYSTPSERRNLEREIFDQLQDGSDINNDNDMHKWGMKKRFSSSFRERILEENNDEENKKALADMFLNQLHSRENLAQDDSDYPELVKDVLNSYGNNENVYREKPRVYTNDRYDKRYFPFDLYPNLGYNNVGMKKRMYMPEYESREDYDHYLETLQVPNQYLDFQRSKERNYQMKKRFRVSKRSSPEKKSTKKDLVKTDAKVEEDLSNVFIKAHKAKLRDIPKKPTKTESTRVNPKVDPHNTASTGKEKNETLKRKSQEDKDKKLLTVSSLNKETVALDSNKQPPLHMEKKSINWSDYFGIDKKKSSDNLDNEWLIERYHKAVAMASDKRDASDPDQPSSKDCEKDDKDNNNNNMPSFSVVSVDKVDADLKHDEEVLIDRALKYTGANQGVIDSSKDLQDLKDEVISKLTAAYNLEKMRQSLRDYKNMMDKDKLPISEENDEIEISGNNQQESEESDESREKRNAKCTDEEKVSLNQGLSSCPNIQNICKDHAVDFLGTFNYVLNSACIYHQTCLLCNKNSWFSSTRECNQLFLEKVNSLCLEDYVCQEVARNSIQPLVNLNKAIVLDRDREECSEYCLEQFTDKPHKHPKTT